MRFSFAKVAVSCLALAVVLTGCQKGADKKVSDGGTAEMPTFTLATSEYPSWSTFIVAGKAGLINPKAGGEPGSLEKKWNVDIVLDVKDYDPCITSFGAGSCDAACLTNMDSLNPSMGRACTMIIPTSTSVGADKVIGVNFTKQRGDEVKKSEAIGQYLANKKVYGLSKSVSEYVFVRGMEKMKISPADCTFVNLEPAPAATALQTGSNDVKVICVWNPFALQTLRTQKSADVLWDSSIIPEEIIDGVVMANDSLKKPGGDRFACCICDTFYEVCKRMNEPKSADQTIKALGEDFSNLSTDDMKTCIKETRFYSTPEAGIKLFTSPEFQTTMKTVVATCEKIKVLADKSPTIGYGDAKAQLNFDPQYMKRSAEGK